MRVKVSCGAERYVVETSGDGTVQSVLLELQRLTGVHPSRQQLICNGQKLTQGTPLQSLTPSSGVQDLTMMLIRREARTFQVSLATRWQSVLRWLSFLWGLVYRFFHSIFVPVSVSRQ
mmetsp:Transcript_13706/g.37479  ORF Transcript_13706/g.37479 Transcript_13706/m.37479 type:complete len:118 (-) Transcript_13706:224-577(-)